MANTLKKEKGFISKMLADGETNTISHKRFVSVICLIMLIALSILSAFDYNTDPEFVYMFAVLTGGESMLTTIEKTGKMINKTDKVVRKKKEEIYEAEDEDEIDA